MATPEENKNQEELNKLLEQENKILREKLKLQSESFDLSSGLVESLKETLGIRSRQTTFESNLLSINKEINKTIANQKSDLSDVNSIQKQINKNNEILKKSNLTQLSLEKSIDNEGKEKIKTTVNLFQAQQDLQSELQAELDKAERGLEINQNLVESTQKQISLNEELVQQEISKLSPMEQQYIFNKLNSDELAKQNKEREKEKENLERIDKKLGVFSGVLKGIGKIPIIGDLVDTKDALQAAREATDKTNSGLKGLKAGLGNLKGQAMQSLTNPANLALFAIVELGKAFLDLDKGIGEFAKGMNLSYQDAAKLDQEFNNIANSSGDIAVTTKGIRETMLAMGQTMGSNAILNEKDAITFTKLREQAGLANDELAAMEKLTLATGGNLEDNVSSMLYAAKTTALNNGVLLNEKQIMKEVAKASDATKLSLAGNPEALAKAAAQAKSLGMNLEQVDKIASGLLDIESSISNELEAELLTGKNLNLEQARLYALNNDMEGLSKEIAKNFGSAAEFSKMNRIQQEAAAKAVGMTREELASTLTDQEALKGLSGEQAKNAKAALDAARARGMSEEEIKKQGIDGLMSQQSMQERFNNSVEKLKEIFVSLLEPLMPILDIFTGILDVVGLIFKPLGAIMGWAQSIGGPLKTVMGLLVGIGAAALLLNGSLTFGLGVAAVLAAVGAGMAMFEGIKSNAETANDMVSPGYGKRTLMGPEGTIALNDKDTVIAGTNLFDKKGDDIVSEPEKITEFKSEGAIGAPSSGGGISIDYNALASAVVSALKNAPMTVNSTLMLDKDVLAKQTIQTVSDNATKVGTAAAVGTSKI